MKKNLLKKIQKAFHPSSSSIYYRNTEVSFISDFIKSSAFILHITGKPGTGKTVTVKNINEGKFTYINYFYTTNITFKIRSSPYDVIVIDEYDKYYSEKKNECIKNILYVKKNKKKIITISNNLSTHRDTNTTSTFYLKFLPYSCEQIQNIIKEKIEKEIGNEEIMGKTVVKYISKKYSQSGDLREVFSFLLEAFSLQKKAIEKISELPNDKENKENRNSIHHHIIGKTREKSKRKAYKEYLKECEELKITSFDRNEFNMIYDMNK